MKKVYIAGAITGTDRLECTLKFNNAESFLQMQGFETVNPLNLIGNWDCPWSDAMRWCIAALVECDAVYFLNDWRDSRGARLEYKVAHSCGLEINYFKGKILDP